MKAEAQNDRRKQSLYFPDATIDEIRAEAARQDRSLSWIVQEAWRIARAEMQARPGIRDLRRTGTAP